MTDPDHDPGSEAGKDSAAPEIPSSGQAIDLVTIALLVYFIALIVIVSVLLLLPLLVK